MWCVWAGFRVHGDWVSICVHVGARLWGSACKHLCTHAHVHVQALVGMGAKRSLSFCEYMSMPTRSVIFYLISLYFLKIFFH